MGKHQYSEWVLEWVSELSRVMKDSAYGFIFTGDTHLDSILNAVKKEQNLNYDHLFKWHKPGGQGALRGTGVFNRTELAVVFHKGEKDLDSIDRSILHSDTVAIKNRMNQNGKKDVGHPAARPVELYDKIIRSFTKERDIVLDPFMGSGTTGISCKRWKRRFIGVELSNEYFLTCKDRISKAKRKAKQTSLDMKSKGDENRS